MRLLRDRTVLKCMDPSECGANFSEKEIKCILDAKTYRALERLRAEAAIREVLMALIPLLISRQILKAWFIVPSAILQPSWTIRPIESLTVRVACKRVVDIAG